MRSHPGGAAHTLRMLELSGLQPPASILDLGGGAGETVALLREQGFEARGIDLEPRSELVEQGDLLHSGFPDGSFDGVLSQCAFYVSGDPEGALREACRLLKPGGMLLLSDVWFTDGAKAAEAAGFRVLHREDMTPLWREYYLEALWTEESVPCGIRGKCTYEMLICVKD